MKINRPFIIFVNELYGRVDKPCTQYSLRCAKIRFFKTCFICGFKKGKQFDSGAGYY